MLATKVNSTNVFSIAYEPKDELLGVTFNNGSIYIYFRVKRKLYDEMKVAESVGSFVHHKIKNVYGSITKEGLAEGTDNNAVYKFFEKIEKVNKVYSKS